MRRIVRILYTILYMIYCVYIFAQLWNQRPSSRRRHCSDWWGRGREEEMGQSYRRDLETEMLRERLSRLNEASWCINESLDFDAVGQAVLDSARYGGCNGHTQAEQDLPGCHCRRCPGPCWQVDGDPGRSPGDFLTGFPVPLALRAALDPTGAREGHPGLRRGSPRPRRAGRLAGDPNSRSRSARPASRALLFSRYSPPNVKTSPKQLQSAVL